MRETVDQLDMVGEQHADRLPTAAADEVIDAATVDVPDGVSAADDGMTLTAEAWADGALGELDADEAEGRHFDIPKQPTGEAAGKAVVEATVEDPQQVPETADKGRPEKPVRQQAARPADLAEIPEAELQKSPHYHRLKAEGTAGDALLPYLHRLALKKDNARELAVARKHVKGDDIDKGLVDRLGDEDGAANNKAADQLTGILNHSLSELQARPDLVKGEKVNWLGLGTALLGRAGAMGDQLDYGDRLTIFTSATTAVMMSENPDDRIAFLQQVAEQGLGSHMERALNQSEISIVQGGFRDADVSMLPSPDVRDDRSIQRLSNFGSVFRASFEDVTRYWQLVERDFDDPGDAHRLMKDAMTDYDDPYAVMGGGSAEVLAEASVAPEQVDKYRIDPTKAERFALEEIFVQAQMDSLFPNGDSGRFERLLASMRRTGSAADELVNLRRQTQELVGDLSHDATRRFRVPSGSPSADWTREQLAAWRYKDLIPEAVVYDDIVKFVDPSVFGRPSNIRTDIYNISQNGAALPDMVTQAMDAVRQMAGKYEAASGDHVSPEELRDLLQANRRQLMKLAAQNADHLSASFASGSIGSADLDDRRPKAENPTTMTRSPDGTLKLEGPIFHPDKASSQAAARLACVALRVNVEQPPAVGEERPKKVNSIELMTKILIDEAYERGIFGKVLAAA